MHPTRIRGSKERWDGRHYRALLKAAPSRRSGTVVMLIGHDRSITNSDLQHFTGRFTDAFRRSIQTVGLDVFEPVEVVLVHRGSSHDPDALLVAQLNEFVAVDQIDRWVSTKGSFACWL